MKQVKGMTRTVLAAVAFMLLGFAFSTSAVAQDIPEPAPQDIPEPAPEQTAPEPEPAPAPAPAPTSGPGVDQLIGAIQDAQAQTAALGEATDLTVDKIQLVSVQDRLAAGGAAVVIRPRPATAAARLVRTVLMCVSPESLDRALPGLAL